MESAISADLFFKACCIWKNKPPQHANLTLGYSTKLFRDAR